MPTAARTCRAVAALLLLTAANAARGQYSTPGVTPGTQPTPAPATRPAPGQARDYSTAGEGERRAEARGGWIVTPSITVKETYTDNAFPDSPTAKSDFITLVTPAIRIEGRTPRLTANLSYAPSAIFYSRNSEANDVANGLSAFASLEAVERFFFIEGTGYISQNFISPFGPRPVDIAAATQNRIETRSASLSPYIRSQGRDLEYELRNRNTWTTTDSNGLGNFRTNQWTGHIGRPVRLFGATLEFEDTSITHYDALVNRPEDKATLYRARLYWQPDAALRFSVSGGTEENNYVLQQEQRTTIYGGAVAWRPSARTSADLEYENRFFGPSRLAAFNHRTRLTAWSVSYSRNASSFQQEAIRLPPGDTAALLDPIFAARFPDPDQRRAAVEQFMRTSGTPASLTNSIAFYTQRVFVREGVDASFAIVGARNSIAFTAFTGEISQISADALGILPDALLFAQKVRQHGFGATADHKFTALTTISARATRVYSHQEQPEDFPSRNDYLNVLLSYTASPRTVLFTGVSVSRFNTDNPNFNPNWDANSVFAGLNYRF